MKDKIKKVIYMPDLSENRKKQMFLEKRQIFYCEKIVSKVTDLLHLSEYKRYQACPGPKISRRPFALGRRIPVVNHWRD